MDSIFFDDQEYIDISIGHLPHWEQKNRLQFVTFRLSDSLPQSFLQEIKNRKEAFIKFHPKPWDTKTKCEFSKLTSSFEDRMLDKGLGSCILKQEDIRRIVISSLEYYDNIKYSLHAYVIMPNHIHMLILPLEAFKIKDLLSSIKRFTAVKINKLLHTNGPVWQSESWDRIVRNEIHYKSCIQYIRNNPKGLQKEEYHLGGFMIE